MNTRAVLLKINFFVFTIFLIMFVYHSAFGQQCQESLKIISHERKIQTELVSEYDIWIHFEGQIYNSNERGAKNVIITYPQFKGYPPIKILFIPPKQMVSYKSDERAISYGSHGERSGKTPPVKTIDNYSPYDELIAEIQCEWE